MPKETVKPKTKERPPSRDEEFEMPGDSPPRNRSRTRSIKEHITPWSLTKDNPVNWLHLDLPDATEQSTRFAENALLTTFVTMTILTASVAAFNWFRLSLGWSVAALALAAFSVRARVEALRESFHADVEKKRSDGHQFEAESVEWVNGIVRRIWKLIDPGLFNVLIDLLHQFLEEHAPSIVTSARVTNLDIGTNAMRMLSFRLLPHDAQVGDSTAPNEAADDQGLDHVNLEGDFTVIYSFALRTKLPAVDFLYSTPPPGEKQRLRNIRFLIHLNFGVKKAAFEVPVNVKVTHISGKIRLRLTLTSDPPFVTHTQVSFPAMPHLRITARPLKTVNVMNLPGISHYILNALRDVLKLFVAPSSWTLDVSRFLMNSEIQLAPQNQGVIVLRIGKLTVQKESVGSEEEFLYITVELSTSSKPAYTTRMLRRTEEEIVFGETAFVLVPRDTLMRDESLRICLFSKSPPQPADRCLDTIDIPLAHLADAPDAHKEQDSDMTDTFELHWSAAYFGVATATRPAANADSRAALYAQRIQEMLDSAVAPPAELKTGLFAIQIHNVVIDADSFSCAIFLDGQMKTKTQLVASGYVNKTIEVLCLDRHHSTVVVAVLDPQDNLRGAMCIRLSTLFAYRSQATRWYSLAGTDAGRIRLSMLFKPLAIDLPPPLFAPDLGTVYVRAISARKTDQFYGHVRLGLMNSNFTTTTAATASNPASENGRYSTPDRQETVWPIEELISIPITSRQQSTLVVEMVPEDPGGPPRYTACYHLSSLGELDDWTTLNLLLHDSLKTAQVSRSLSDFALNMLHPQSTSPKKKSKSNTPDRVSREPSPVRHTSDVAQVRVELRFVGGSSDSFATLAEAWPTQAIQDAALGLRATHLAMQIPEADTPGVPPNHPSNDWGDTDVAKENPPASKRMSDAGDLKTTSLKSRKGPVSWMKSLSGKSKKE